MTLCDTAQSTSKDLVPFSWPRKKDKDTFTHFIIGTFRVNTHLQHRDNSPYLTNPYRIPEVRRWLLSTYPWRTTLGIVSGQMTWPNHTSFCRIMVANRGYWGLIKEVITCGHTAPDHFECLDPSLLFCELGLRLVQHDWDNEILVKPELFVEDEASTVQDLAEPRHRRCCFREPEANICIETTLLWNSLAQAFEKLLLPWLYSVYSYLCFVGSDGLRHDFAIVLCTHAGGEFVGEGLQHAAAAHHHFDVVGKVEVGHRGVMVLECIQVDVKRQWGQSSTLAYTHRREKELTQLTGGRNTT